MAVVRAILAIAPRFYMDMLAILVSIFIPIFLLLLSLNQDMVTLFSFVKTFVRLGKVNELSLIFIPLGFLFLFATCSSLMFLSDLKDKKFLKWLQIPWGTTIIGLILAITINFYFLFKARGGTISYEYVAGAVYFSITCLCLITFFISIVTHWSIGDGARVRRRRRS
jgi:hypothetical protein